MDSDNQVAVLTSGRVFRAQDLWSGSHDQVFYASSLLRVLRKRLHDREFFLETSLLENAGVVSCAKKLLTCLHLS